MYRERRYYASQSKVISIFNRTILVMLKERYHIIKRVESAPLCLRMKLK